MGIPAVGSRSSRLMNLANTVANSATFQQLVGAASFGSALGFIHVDFAGDLELDSFFAPYPRAVIRHRGPQLAEREGTDTFLGTGEMLVYVQYEQLSQADLATWYSIEGPFTEVDQRLHMNNLFGAITDEMRLLATTAGCLEFQRIEEFSCGFINPSTENGNALVELTWCIFREGLP